MANPIVHQINAELEALQNELKQFKSTVDYLNNAKKHVNNAVESVNHSEANFNNKVEELKQTYDSFIKLTEAVSLVVSKIDSVNFPERLDNIEKTVKSTITNLNEIREATLEELHSASEIITKADFDGKFKKLQFAIDTTVKSNNDTAESIQKLKLIEKIDGFEKSLTKKIGSSISDLENNTKQIASESSKSFHELNLPTRIDKLDSIISRILTTIQKIHDRFDSVERNINDKLTESNQQQSDTILYLQELLIQNIVTLDTEIKSTSKKQNTHTFISWALMIICTALIIFLCKN